MDEPEALHIPIDGILDLHTFRPEEIKDLVPDYVGACLDRGIFQVRIVHGKGTGALRRKVHAILKRMSIVASFHLAARETGGWGATVVYLRRPDGFPPESTAG